MKKFLDITSLFIFGAMLFNLGYYCSAMKCGILHMGYSAPAHTAIFVCVPYIIILACTKCASRAVGKKG
ncbi:MAG: hypothetical protein IKM61_03750 [Eubacteriaceae bacterium]|nr:hypothetical protein [Eubacteriaceae bacterium]